MKKFVALSFFAALLFGQAEKKKLTFEVVSIKSNNSSDANWRLRGLGDAGGRFSASNVDLRFLIGAAYGDPNPVLLGNNSTVITGLSGWANTAKYDVEAQPEAGFNPTAQQRQEMLQSMLEDRFKLKIRVEPKDQPIYTLVVDSGGLKMKLYAPRLPAPHHHRFPDPVPPVAGSSACSGRTWRRLWAS